MGSPNLSKVKVTETCHPFQLQTSVPRNQMKHTDTAYFICLLKVALHYQVKIRSHDTLKSTLCRKDTEQKLNKSCLFFLKIVGCFSPCGFGLIFNSLWCKITVRGLWIIHDKKLLVFDYCNTDLVLLLIRQRLSRSVPLRPSCIWDDIVPHK